MLYIDTSGTATPTYTPVAHSSSHTIDYAAETKDRKTKDTGVWAVKVVTGLSASISCEALQTYDAVVGKEKLLDLMLSRTPVKAKYSHAVEQVGDVYYEGTFVITSVNDSTPAEGDATYSVKMESSGEITKKSKTV